MNRLSCAAFVLALTCMTAGCTARSATEPRCIALWPLEPAEALTLGLDSGQLILEGPCVDQSERGRTRFLRIANGLMKATFGREFHLTQTERYVIEGHPEETCWGTADEVLDAKGKSVWVTCRPVGYGKACEYRINALGYVSMKQVPAGAASAPG